ncbi:uncharacterized protein LOC143332620 [Chaetodon auriga]|uniref:uncharacterized protein LOC143332620 n=1 Tax=Chaetodon auriga TaxID=39042 RepID=UPI004032C089
MTRCSLPLSLVVAAVYQMVMEEGEEQRRKNTALGGSSADGLCVGDVFPQLHALFPVRQEVCNPPASGVRHAQLGELLLKQSWGDGVEGRPEIHKQDPSIGSCRVQVLEDEVEGQVDCIVYRPVGYVGKLQGVQERVGDVLEV